MGLPAWQCGYTLLSHCSWTVSWPGVFAKSQLGVMLTFRRCCKTWMVSASFSRPRWCCSGKSRSRSDWHLQCQHLQCGVLQGGAVETKDNLDGLFKTRECSWLWRLCLQMLWLQTDIEGHKCIAHIYHHENGYFGDIQPTCVDCDCRAHFHSCKKLYLLAAHPIREHEGKVLYNRSMSGVEKLYGINIVLIFSCMFKGTYVSHTWHYCTCQTV